MLSNLTGHNANKVGQSGAIAKWDARVSHHASRYILLHSVYDLELLR